MSRLLFLDLEPSLLAPIEVLNRVKFFGDWVESESD